MATLTDAERLELGSYLRRAAIDPDKQSPLRKMAFRRMLDLSRDPGLDASCKKLIAERVKDFFVDFPDFQDEAINVVYDMCEDQEQEIRMAGYGAVTSISRRNQSWIVRNADVLVQLLQSDDSYEVAVIKRALQEHIDLDPRSTLQVLCDQCMLNSTEFVDDEERMLRVRLRGLVLQFLAEKYRACLSRAVKEYDVEMILLRTLTEVIPQVSSSELRTIVNGIILNIPSLSNGLTQEGNAILGALLDATRNTLETDDPDVIKLCSLTEEVVCIINPSPTMGRSESAGLPVPGTPSIRPGPIGDALNVLRFFADDSLMQRVPREAGLKVAECVCAAYRSSMVYSDHLATRCQMANIVPSLLNVLIKCIPAQKVDAISRLCLISLRALQEYIINAKEGYSLPPRLVVALKALISELSSVSSIGNTVKRRATDAGTTRQEQTCAVELCVEAKQVIGISRSLLHAVERQNHGDLSSAQDRLPKATTRHGGPDFSVPASSPPGSPLERNAGRGAAATRQSSGRTQQISTGSQLEGGIDRDSAPHAWKKPRKNGIGDALREADSGSSSLLNRLRPSTVELASEASRKTNSCRLSGSPANVSHGDNRSGTLLSRITNNSNSRTGDIECAASDGLRGLALSVSVDMRNGTRLHTKKFLTNGGNEQAGSLDTAQKLGLKGSSCIEPMEIKILGASASSEGEIKIRGAAERHGVDEKETRALSGGGLSLLARLGDSRGSAIGDHGNGRKRKRTNRN